MGTECDNAKRESTDILIVPQFSLGGKLKSGKKGAQYNSSEKPAIAKVHFENLCAKLIKRNETNQANKKQKDKYLNVNVKCGIFGNRQGLRIESDGPFTHSFDINMVPQNDEKKRPKKIKNNSEKSDDISNQSNASSMI